MVESRAQEASRDKHNFESGSQARPHNGGRAEASFFAGTGVLPHLVLEARDGKG